MLTVYTKDNCPACLTVKASLKQQGKPFTEVNVGKDITREEFMQKFPTVRRLPLTVVEGEIK